MEVFSLYFSTCQGVWDPVVGREDLRLRNKARRNGSEERPEWGASPAKPSKPLRTDTKRIALPLGVRTEFLAGCPPDSQQTFQQQGTLSRSFVRAPGGGAKCPAR